MGDTQQRPKIKMKKRTHVSIAQSLYQEASAYAEEVLHTDFSGLVTRLLVEELGKRKLIDRLASPSDRILAELVRRLEAGQPGASSPLDKIAAEQQVIHDADGAKPRDVRGKKRATGRAVQVKTGLRRI
jgi:hypothetical protein